MATKTAEATTSWEEHDAPPPPPSSGITVRKVIHEFVPMKLGAKDSMSFGQRIDAMIEESLMEGGQVQSVEINITDMDWDTLRHEFRKTI